LVAPAYAGIVAVDDSEAAARRFARLFELSTAG
jgi:hypothetical protein